ncbi:hypothetical protein FB446DRAFT_708540 [Lentinula raphanica]|nr:hypothetical protein FB446DRAFT_708540 [Lentinula raphanica]
MHRALQCGVILLAFFCSQVSTVESELTWYELGTETPTSTITQRAKPIGTNSATQTTFLLEQLLGVTEWITFRDEGVSQLMTITGTLTGTAVVSATGWRLPVTDAQYMDCHLTSPTSGECILESIIDSEHFSTFTTLAAGEALPLFIPITSSTAISPTQVSSKASATLIAASAGGTVAALIVIVCITVLLWRWQRRRRSQRSDTEKISGLLITLRDADGEIVQGGTLLPSLVPNGNRRPNQDAQPERLNEILPLEAHREPLHALRDDARVDSQSQEYTALQHLQHGISEILVRLGQLEQENFPPEYASQASGQSLRGSRHGSA